MNQRRGDNRRRVKDAASICHSADGMSGENREIGPSRSCSNSPRNPSSKSSTFSNPSSFYLCLPFPLRKFACLEIFFLPSNAFASRDYSSRWPKRYFFPPSLSAVGDFCSFKSIVRSLRLNFKFKSVYKRDKAYYRCKIITTKRQKNIKLIVRVQITTSWLARLK